MVNLIFLLWCFCFMCSCDNKRLFMAYPYFCSVCKFLQKDSTHPVSRWQNLVASFLHGLQFPFIPIYSVGKKTNPRLKGHSSLNVKEVILKTVMFSCQCVQLCGNYVK